MKPTNKKEYNRSILGFFAMWAITTALIVFACLKLFSIGDKECEDLMEQVQKLKIVSTQHDLICETVNGINATMDTLEQKYSMQTLQRLRSYPKVELTDIKTKEDLAELSTQIADFYKQRNESASNVEKELQTCRREQTLKDTEISTLQATIQQLQLQISQLQFQLGQTSNQ